MEKEILGISIADERYQRQMYKKDYSEQNFIRDVHEADELYFEGRISREDYECKILCYAEWYGIRKKVSKNILRQRNL